jgi:amino acid transporter
VAGGRPIGAHQLVAVGSILLLGAINYIGVRSGSRTNAVMTVAKVAGLLLLVLFAIGSSKVAPAWAPIVPSEDSSPLAAFGVTVIAMLWAAEGCSFLACTARFVAVLLSDRAGDRGRIALLLGRLLRRASRRAVLFDCDREGTRQLAIALRHGRR